MTWKKGKGKQYHLSRLYDIKAAGKNIKWGKGKGYKISGKKIKILKNGGGEENIVEGNFIQPFIFIDILKTIVSDVNG